MSRSPFVGETEKGDRQGSILAQVTTTQCFLNNADLNESLDLFHIGGKRFADDWEKGSSLSDKDFQLYVFFLRTLFWMVLVNRIPDFIL